MLTFKLKYKKYMKAMSAIGCFFMIIVFLLIFGFFVNIGFDWLDVVLHELGEWMGLLFLTSAWAFSMYAFLSVKNKAKLDKDLNEIKIYSLSTVFWRTTDIDTIDNIIAHRNSELQCKWIEDDAVVVTLVTRHHRINFPISEDDWLMFKNHPKISKKTIIE